MQCGHFCRKGESIFANFKLINIFTKRPPINKSEIAAYTVKQAVGIKNNSKKIGSE